MWLHYNLLGALQFSVAHGPTPSPDIDRAFTHFVGRGHRAGE